MTRNAINKSKWKERNENKKKRAGGMMVMIWGIFSNDRRYQTSYTRKLNKKKKKKKNPQKIEDEARKRENERAHSKRLSRSLCGSLLSQGLPHHRILTRHAPSQSAVHLGTQGQLVEALGLFSGGDEALLLKAFVLETLQAVAQVVNFGQAGVTARQAGGSVGGDRGASADRGESLGYAVLIEVR